MKRLLIVIAGLAAVLICAYYPPERVLIALVVGYAAHKFDNG